MQFGIFYEHQLPRPWQADDEYRLIQDALVQVELADQIGIDYVWEVEHHFLEEYSHSSAPEVFLAACSQRTQRIKLGHGIVLAPPPYNHPARVAERLAMLDLVSGGRAQWGTGKSSSRIEIEGFAIDPNARHAMWLEAVGETAKMMCTTPYAGYQGDFFSMPPRNVVPKPRQKPHPPLWMACSNRETIMEAARLGLGALCFAFVDAQDARHWVQEYYATFRAECQPLGRSVNPNVAMVAGFMCHAQSEVAVERGLEGFQFFSYALSHYYGHGTHLPGHFDLWADFQRQRTADREPTGCIGNPAQVRTHLEMLEAAGVDQVIFIQQAGNNQQSHILESLQIFAKELLPAFQAREITHAQRKAAELAPYIAQALSKLPPLPQAVVEPVDAYPVLLQKLAAQAAQANGTEPAEEGSLVEMVETALLGKRG